MLLAAIVSPSLALASITLPLPWKLADAHRYQSVTVLDKTRAGKTQRIETREVDKITIAEAGPKGFLQVWHAESSKLAITGESENSAADQALATQLQDGFRDLSLEAELQPDGAFLRLRNWKVLGERMRELMLPALVAQAKARPELAKTDEAEIRAKLVPVLERMTSEQAISNSLGKNIAIYNFFMAASLNVGEPTIYEDYLPSPWSADLIPTRGSFRLVGTDERAGTDEATVVVDRKSGLPLKLSHQRRVEVGSASNMNTWTLDKLPD